MKPKRLNQSQDRFFEMRLNDQLNPNHELMIFSKVMDWDRLEEEFQDYFSAERGAPARPIRLILGVMLLQHMYKLSDEAVIAHWVENPYWQAFCGYGNSCEGNNFTSFLQARCRQVAYHRKNGKTI